MGRAQKFLWFMRLIIFIIFLLSLALSAIRPTVFNTLHTSWQKGYVILLSGWFGILVGQIEWLGNPALMVALIVPLSRFSRWVIAPLLAACSFQALFYLKSIPDTPGDVIIAFGAGYYLWLASLVLGIVLVFAAWLIGNKEAVV